LRDAKERLRAGLLPVGVGAAQPEEVHFALKAQVRRDFVEDAPAEHRPDGLPHVAQFALVRDRADAGGDFEGMVGAAEAAQVAVHGVAVILARLGQDRQREDQQQQRGKDFRKRQPRRVYAGCFFHAGRL
jgi:hypothetical protein